MLYMVILIGSAQMNIRTSKMLIGELDSLVDHGLFRSRTEAVNEAIRLLIRRYRAANIAQNIEAIAQKNKGDKSVTDALATLREEEDE